MWVTPCDCKTPKGMSKKFFSVFNLVAHLTKEHSEEFEVKSLYRLKSQVVSVSSNIGKKRSSLEMEEGFQEFKTIEEDEEAQKDEQEIVNLSKLFTTSTKLENKNEADDEDDTD